MTPNKAKGKRYEYEIRDYFRSIGYNECIISSAESKNADSMGIDLLGLPYIIQCKNGYKSGLKYMDLLNSILKRTKTSKFAGFPIYLFHKTNRRTEVTMFVSEYLRLTERKEVVVDAKTKYFCKNWDGTVSIDFDTFKLLIK